MHIGLFSDCYTPQVSGVVTSLKTLERELRKLGHKVTVVTVKVPGYYDERTDVLRIPSVPFVRCLEFRVGIPTYNETYRKIKKLGLDVIHTHTEFTVGLMGKHLATVMNIPVVHTYHTMYEDYSHYVFDHAYGKNVIKKIITTSSRAYVKKYDRIIAPSLKTRNALRSYGVINEIRIIPTGIDIKKFEHSYNKVEEAGIRRKYGLSKDDFVILALGRVSKEKSIDAIIRQLPKVLKFIPKAQLMIVGDGPLKNTLKMMVAEMNLESYVTFTGQVPFEEVGKFYSLANIFASASQTETQGLTIVEAIASKTPVVVYDDLNIDGLVIQGVSGRLFQRETSLSHQIIAAYNNPSETERMVDNGYKIVQDLSKENFAAHVEDVYAHMVKRAKSKETSKRYIRTGR